jgi:hypothetical protein
MLKFYLKMQKEFQNQNDGYQRNKNKRSNFTKTKITTDFDYKIGLDKNTGPDFWLQHVFSHLILKTLPVIRPKRVNKHI